MTTTTSEKTTKEGRRRLLRRKKYVIGVDGGTGGIRCHLFDCATGRSVRAVERTYDTTYGIPRAGCATQICDEWVARMCDATRELLLLKFEETKNQEEEEEGKISIDDIAAMCVDTTCCSVVFMDEDGKSLYPCIMWCDMRAGAKETKDVLVHARRDATRRKEGKEEKEEAKKKETRRMRMAKTMRVNCDGEGPVSAEWMVPKALWMKRHEREVFDRATRVCEYQDYMNFRLTRRYCASANNVSVRWHFREEDGKKVPPKELLEALELEDLLEKWPKEVLKCGEVVGNITEEAFEELFKGAKYREIPVVQGGADAFIGMVGLGAIQPKTMALITGSSHLHLAVTEKSMFGKGMFGAYENALVPEAKFIVEGGQTSTGSITNWFKEQFNCTYEDIFKEAEEIPIGCEGLVALDHFQGNRTPHVDAESKGCFTGLTLKHSRAHMFRAILESICFGTKAVVDTMRKNGTKIETIVIAGGATRSRFWLQMHADVTNCEVIVTECPDAPALGCAILASVGVGIYQTAEEACGHMVKRLETIKPNKKSTTEYEKVYEKAYSKLYGLCKTLRKEREEEEDAIDNNAVKKRKASDDTVSIDKYDDSSTLKIALSLLAAPDHANLISATSIALDASADWIHVDVFDGQFVPVVNFGPSTVQSLRRNFPTAFLDCHLSCQNPEFYIENGLGESASQISFHPEAVETFTERKKMCEKIKFQYNKRASMSINPSTKLEDTSVFELLELNLLDCVNVLAVQPGFGGQTLQPDALEKVKRLRARSETVDIQVDGGVNLETIESVVKAGANVVVSGSFIFRDNKGKEKEAVEMLRAFRR